MSREPKPIPRFATEAGERAFWESHDSTDYVDWSRARNVSFPNLRRTPQSISADSSHKGAAKQHDGKSHGL
jgi:hypothetical protein